MKSKFDTTGEAPPVVQNILQTTDRQNCNSKFSKVKKNTKEYVILAALASGRSLNRFEAIQLHDTCLNSTVATLQSKGISIFREFEKVRCVNKTKTVDVMRYRLLPTEIEKAQKLLAVMS